MKLLTLPLLLCAMIVLSRAATTPDAKDEPEKEKPTPEDAEEEDEAEEEEGTEEPETEDDSEDEAGNSTKTEGGKHIVKRALSRCPRGWSTYGRRCFLYYGGARTWAQAERVCQAYGGNLVSLHSSSEYSWLQRFIYSKTRRNTIVWLGGSDSEQNGYWLWSDGTRYRYGGWCSGQPRSSSTLNCMRFNYQVSGCRKKCWEATYCHYRYTFVCARRR